MSMNDYRRTGLPLQRIRDPRIVRRFAKKILAVGPGSVPGCWLWQGYVGKDGYGKFRFGGTVVNAHRVAYAIWKGPVPEGMDVHHSHTPEGYDAPLTHCVNPKHLELLSASENRAESVERTGPRGAVKKQMLKRLESNSDVETFECPRCRGTMIRLHNTSKYVCINCPNTLDEIEVREYEDQAVDVGDIPV